MFNRSCRICLAVSLSILTICVIIRMLKRRSFRKFHWFSQRFFRCFMSKGVPDVRRIPLSPGLQVWTVRAIHTLAYVTQHYHHIPPLTAGHILSDYFQFNKKFQTDALLDFLPSHESVRTEHIHTQTKPRGKLTDVERRVQFCSILEASRSLPSTRSPVLRVTPVECAQFRYLTAASLI
jgi:hypothetical protein